MKRSEGKPERRNAAMLALRVSAIGLAVLACIGVALPVPTKARTVVVLLDVSDSVPRERIEASRAASLALIRSLKARDRAAAAIFAGETVMLCPPVEPDEAAAVLESAELSLDASGTTDIALALATARQLAREGPGSKTVYLFSDGRANAGSPPSRSEESPVTIQAVSVGGTRSGLASLGFKVPGVVRSGERAKATWNLVSDTERKITYTLSMDGRPVSAGTASLASGSNALRLELDAGEAGMKALSIAAEEAGTPVLTAGAFLEVSGPAKVLVVSGGAFASSGQVVSPLSKALAAQGMSVVSGGPETLSETAIGYAGISAVVLDDLPALAITEAQQERLQDYVSGGGGLLVVGGESSLGRGDYYATPLEDLLPVETDSRRRLQFTRAKLLFVIDRSGSMAEEVGATTKKTAAIRGVAAAVSQLSPLDEVGIISFDTMPTWVVPFTPASEKEKILAPLADISDGSGTDLASALTEAARGFGPPGPSKRHVIILTDGLTADADFADIASKLVAVGATASTIAIGDTVDEELLRDLAARCGGTYYRAQADKIPAVIDEEAIRMTRELIQEGRIETRIVSSSSLVEGLGRNLPRLGGYLLTTPKPHASIEIEARAAAPAADQGWDPLLVSWRYGNGKVAVFTSDSGRRWLSAWSSLPVYNRLWGQALRSVARAAPDGSLRPRAIAEAGGARLIVDAVGPDRQSLSSLRLVGKVQGEGGSFGFVETAPGRYEGFAPLRGSGLFGIDLFDPLSRASGFSWVWSEPRAESPNLGPDPAALSLIASANGGELVSADLLRVPPERTSWESRSLRPFLLIAAAFLLLVDLFLRSTMAGQLERALVAGATWWSKQKTDAERTLFSPRPEEPSTDPERESRSFEMQRRMAERVAARAERAAARDAESEEVRDEKRR